MDTLSKLQMLSDASQYDLSCACGTKSGDDHRKRGSDGTWLYPVSLPRGGNSVMLKTLMSNVCVNDCGYCPYRDSRDVPRCTIGPDELATLFLEYVRSKRVIGLFLSSGVIGTPDRTMTLLTDTARLLRKKHRYRGYVHLKIIPGASDAAIDEALRLASTVSINIETPGERHFSQLSRRKNYLNDIIRPMQRISRLTAKGGQYAKVGQTTQFVVGASDETDAEIVRYMEGLYKKLNVGRVYFSAYQRGLGDGNIPGERRETPEKATAGFVREHRLYQVDFLMRLYRFSGADIAFDAGGSLPADIDPKMHWAQRHPEFFPVNVNRADRYELLRVPGIGPRSASRIVSMRREGRIGSVDNLPMRSAWRERAKKYVTAS
ncbi:MAG: helix-hairpin-helix domain-containing protein [Chitinispirillaceae bacterium]|nr:helix-hairpin-helix domain-containing protein [Chitinispirillaceae bacterium]